MRNNLSHGSTTLATADAQRRPRAKDELYFPEGILGFEQVRVFRLVRWNDFDPLEFLISGEGPRLSLPVIKPNLFLREYEPRPTRDDLRILRTTSRDELETLCVVTVGNGDCTVNLRGPIFVNWANQLARQRVLAESRFKVSHRLTPELRLVDPPELGR